MSEILKSQSLLIPWKWKNNKEYYEEFCSHKLDNLDEIDQMKDKIYQNSHKEK